MRYLVLCVVGVIWPALVVWTIDDQRIAVWLNVLGVFTVIAAAPDHPYYSEEISEDDHE